MSTTIDNRIVEMEFDNAQFEKGIRTSLKSLEDLKKGLDLDKAVSSLSNLERAANKFDLSGIQNAVESLQNRFSTLGVIGMTALENITNKAINAGTALMKSLSVDQIASGMSKYEAETQAIATMRYALPDGMTEEGTGKIYDAIEKLQKYSDETSYSFSTMVDNMGKFIAAGVKLETAEKSMEGIANWAAMSGTSAQSANFARVMYNLSQAMGSGNVKLMDWMSIENANMATAGFKKQVIETAKEMGKIVEVEGQLYAAGVKLTDANKENHKITAENMRNTLSDGWFTADVLNEVLKVYAESEEAFKAAQQARTFTDAIEAAKDAVSTGWARSFRLIFGDINQATEYFTDLANAIISVTDMVASFRNGILEVWSNFGGRNELVEAFWNIWDILRGIGRSMLEAFGLTSAGLVEKLGKGLYEVTHRFNEATAAILSLFDAYKVLTGGGVEKKTTKTTKTISGDLADLQKHARESEEAVRGMINTGTVKMKPQTVETFTALADAYKELDEYLASGKVTSEGLAERLAKINELNEKAGKTNKLMSWKQKALKAMRGELDAYKDVSAETIATTNETTTEMTEAEEEIYYHSARLKEIFKGLKDFFGLFIDTVSGVKSETFQFASLFTPLVKPVINLASSFAALISHIRETGVVSDSVKGWVSQILNAFSPLTDKIGVVVGWFETLQKAIYDRDYGKRAFFDESSMEFLTGPIGEKIKNVAGGIQSAINIVVRVLSSAISVVSTFVSTFILPLIGPAAMAVLDFFSGLGKAIMGLDSGIGSLDAITAISNQIKDFLATIRDNIVASPIFQRAKTILTSFFKIFSTNPTAAVNYLKAVSRGLLEPVKNSELYKSASSKLKSFGKGILNTIRNSKGLTKARRYAELFFNVFKKDPKKGMKMLRSFGKQLIQSIMGSKPIQALNSFKQKISDFFGKLFPKKESDKTKSAASRFMTNFGKIFEEKGLGSALDFAKNSIVKKLSEWSRAFAESPVGQKAIAFKNSLVKTFNNLKAELQENELVQRFLNFFARLQAAFDENGISGVIDTLKETFIRKFGELKQAIVQNEIVQKAIVFKNSLKQAFADFSEKIGLGEKIEKIKKWFADLKKTFEEKGPITALTKFKNTVVQKFTTLMSGISVQSIIQKFQSFFSQIKESIQNANVGAAFDELKKTIKEKIKGLLPTPSEALEGEEGSGLLENIKNTIGQWVDGLKQAFGEGGQSAFDGIGKKLTKLLVSGIAIAFGVVLIKIMNGLGNITNGLGKLFKKMSGGGFLKGLFGEKEDGASSAAKVLTSLAIAVGAIAGSIFLLSLLPADKLQQGIGALIGCLTTIALFAAGVKTLGLETALTGLRDAGIGMIACAGAVMILVIAVNMLNAMDWGVFLNGGSKLVILMAAMGAFLALTTKYGGGAFKSNWASILAVAVAIRLLIKPIQELAAMSDPFAVVGAIVVIGLLMTEIGGLLVVLNKFGGGGGLKQAATIYAIGKAVGMMADAFIDIGNLNAGQLVKGLIGMAAIVGSFVALSIFAPKDVTKVGTMFAAMIVVIGSLFAFTEALKRVADIPTDTMISFATSFAIFMVSFSIALGIMALIPVGAAVAGAAGLAVAIVLLGAALSLAAHMGGNAAQGLSENMFVVGANLSAFSNMVSGLNTEAINTAIQVMRDFSAAAIEVMGYEYGQLDNLGNAMADYGADVLLFNGMVSGFDTAAAGAAIQFMKDFKEAAIEVMGVEYGPLDNFRTSIMRMGAGLRLYSSLTSDLSSPEQDPLKTIAESLKTVNQDMSGLTDIGDLTTAITNMGAAAKLYYDEISGIDTSKGVADLSGIGAAFSALASNMPDDASIDNIASYAAGGGNDLTNFALGITAISTAFNEFAKIADEVKEDKVTAATTALERIKTISEGMKSDKVDFSFLGVLTAHKESLTTFPEDIVLLGGALKEFATSIGGEDVDLTKVDQGITALGKIKDINTALTGETVSWDFLGILHPKKDQLTNFAEDVVELGKALNSFGTSIGAEGVDLAKMSESVNILDEFTKIQDKLPMVGGISSWLDGEQDLGNFGSKLNSLGVGVANYADAIKGRDFANAEASVGPLRALARVQNILGKTGGLAQFFSGVQSLSTFGSELSQLGTGVAGYADAIKGKDFSNAESSVGPLLALARAHEMINSAPNWASLDSFGDSITSIGTKLATFQTDTMSIDANRINTVVAAINSLLALGQTQAGANTAADGAKNIFNFLKGLTDKQGGFAGIGDSTIAELAGGLASDFVEAFNNGLSNGESSAKIQGGYLGQAARDGAASWINDFDTVGYNMSIGLANGITSGIYQVTSAAYNVGAAALGAAQAAVNSHSPSLKFMELGMFMDEGLAIGLTSYAGMVREAAGDSAESALTETASVVAKVSSMLAQGVDEAPTIRPVLDLTDITTGVAAMNGMLPGTYGMRVNGIMPTLSTARANAISENQPTAGSADVVNAVNSLAARLDLLEETMSSLNVVLDTGATVGGLAPAMNKEFGSQSLLDERNI